MTQAQTLDRPIRPFPHQPFAFTPRPVAPAKPLTVVAPAPPAAPAHEVALDGMIRAIGQATSRMAELLDQLHDQERVIVELQEANEALRRRAESAETNARLHEVRASEALLKAEQLQAQKQMNADEHDRLKASIDTLLAMFGGEEQFVAAASRA